MPQASLGCRARGGQADVVQALEILKAEIDRTLGPIGILRIADLDRLGIRCAGPGAA